MFIVSAEFRDKVEVKAGIDKVRAFIFDLQNFAKLMPNVESIKKDAKDITGWTIAVDIPAMGKIRESFPVELEKPPEDEVEWRPPAGEKENLLRYMALLVERKQGSTVIQISQKVELRRSK